MMENEKVLVLDTSTNLMVIGLILNGEEYLIKKEFIKNHSKTIIFEIENFLKSKFLKISDLTEIIVGYGPGSYTGIRIAVVVAKMLAYSLKRPLYKVSSLGLLSSGYKEVTAIMDARNDNAYIGKYQYGNTINSDCYVCNYSLMEYSNPVVLNSDTCNISLRNVYNNKRLVENIYTFLPNYLRETEAERTRVLRKTEITDITDIVRLEKEQLGNTLGFDFIKADLDSIGTCYYSYLINNTLVGYISSRYDCDSAEILNIVVEKKYQNHGIGKILVNSLIETLFAKDVLEIFLEVNENNKKAICLYENIGFKFSHKRVKYYNDADALVYIYRRKV